jgi:hypothetical protein
VPTLSDDVAKVADPVLSVPVANVVVPSLKVTVPVGVPLPVVGVTVAVNVTLCPNTLGFLDDSRVVVVPVDPTD